MKQLFAIIATALAGMGRLVTKIVREVGRWVSRLVREPGQPVPMPSTPAPVADRVDDYAPVKRLAAVLASGGDPRPEDVKGVSELTFRWLSSMERDSLLKIALADPNDLRGHMRGRQPIKGLVPYDKAAIDDVAAAKDKLRPAERGRTLRDELEEQLGVSLAA